MNLIQRMLPGLFGLCMIAAQPMHAQIYRHVDDETGVVTLSNVPFAKEEDPPCKQRKTQPKGACSATDRKPAKAPPPADPPAPRNRLAVPGEVQTRRDGERLQILIDELKAERRAYAQSFAAGAPRERLRGHRENIAALEREIAGVRRGGAADVAGGRL